MSIHGTGARACLLLAVCLALSATTAWSQGLTGPKQGQGGSVVQGAAGRRRLRGPTRSL